MSRVTMLIKNFRYLIYLVVLFAFSLARAGSYEDFFFAIKRDNPATIQALLSRGFDPNTPSADGQHGLYLALQEGSLQAAAVLLKAPQLAADTRNAHDETPLMMAALKGHTAFVRDLIARDADVNKTGWTPLHYAATGGHLDIIRMLLDAHAYIDAESPNATTPLMMAAQYGTQEAVKLLLEAGADPLLRNQRGLTAVDFARLGGREPVIDMIAAAVRQKRPRGTW